MDPASSIPKISKSLPVPEYRENPFDHPMEDLAKHQRDEQEAKKEKAKKDEEHHSGNDPNLGHILDVDG